MKFISKNANLRVVVEHGMPAEPITGRQAKPGVYVKFQNGVVNIEDKELVRKLLNHPAFNVDFILVEEDQSDPFSNTRKNIEPAHQLVEMKYGAPGKVDGDKTKIKFSAEQMEVVKALASELAKGMLKNIAKDSDVGEIGDADSSDKEEIKKPKKKATSKSTK